MITSRLGTTLTELVVVLAVLSLLFGLSATALITLRPPADQEKRLRFEAARRRALHTGKLVTIPADSMGTLVLFLPDGRALGPGFEPLSGRPVHHAE